MSEDTALWRATALSAFTAKRVIASAPVNDSEASGRTLPSWFDAIAVNMYDPYTATAARCPMHQAAVARYMKFTARRAASTWAEWSSTAASASSSSALH